MLLPGEGRLGAVRAACGVLAVQIVCAGAVAAARFTIIRPGALQRHALCTHSLFMMAFHALLMSAQSRK